MRGHSASTRKVATSVAKVVTLCILKTGPIGFSDRLKAVYIKRKALRMSQRFLTE